MLAAYLKNYCVTRWYSYLRLLKSILKNWVSIQGILAKNGKMHRTEEINFSTLISLVELS